ncbi:uncharacterized protein [Fopius arisanus]|uniref:Uncharacterized protein isoform X2 n=1 Tax=Fopius arisanus TaxID=64838 RepID=A0A9R1STH3_9HYME|nr:PREDICTED: uncharacterized protein LOC105262782 isoform X2 [Fopius arisanus]
MRLYSFKGIGIGFRMVDKLIRSLLAFSIIQPVVWSTVSITNGLGWGKSIFASEECREERQPVVESYRHDGMQYLFFSQRVTWEEARMLCRSYNSRLALLDTMEKALGVARSIAESNIVMEDTWLGGRRIDFVWYWIDKETGPWRNEISMEPNVEDYPPWSREPIRPTKECLGIDRSSHEHPNFIDMDCRLQRPFICEKNAGEIISSPVPSKWIQINRNTYVLYHGRVTWPEAATFCRTKGARLAILKNSMIINILTNSMTKTRPDFESVWIGAYHSYGQWVWMATGSVLNSLTDEGGYPPWRFGRPEKNNGCLLLDRHIEDNSTFVEAACDRKRDFICEEYDEEGDWMDEPAKFSYENNSYIIYPIYKTWMESRDFCNERGSVLAYVEHIDIVSLIIEAMGDHPREIAHVWLGGKYNMTLDEWRWIGTGGKILREKDNSGFPPWTHIDGEIETDLDSTICLNLDRTDHVKPHFYGLDCSSKQSFVCKITCDIPPPIEDGKWTCSEVIDGRQCLLDCDNGLIMTGIKNVTCTFQNGWTSGNNPMEFPLCLQPKAFATRMIRSLSQDIQKSSGYYLLLDHSSSGLKPILMEFIERIVTSFPASRNLKFGMTTYLTNPPTHLPFNQTDKCAVISAIRSLQNNALDTKPAAVNISTIQKDISIYNGRRISIIAVMDSKRGAAYADALMQFKAVGHHIIVVALREDAEALLPLATIGFDRRINLFLFEEAELAAVANEIKRHERKRSRCSDNTKTDSTTVGINIPTVEYHGITETNRYDTIPSESKEESSSLAPNLKTEEPEDDTWKLVPHNPLTESTAKRETEFDEEEES